jgi:hypothetical protein
MAESLTPEEWEEMFRRDAGAGVPDMSDRDSACLILEAMNYEQQLIAISGVLQRNKAADEQLEAERKEIIDFIKRSSGFAQDHAIGESGENFYAMVYQGAAHSMAALGMIAPLFESMFYHAFQGIRKWHFGMNVIPSGHVRANLKEAEPFWDCRLLCIPASPKPEKKLVPGIEQLAEAVGLTAFLPADLHATLEPLFSYRNKMFHNGLEWPALECQRFALRIEQEKWQEWFESAKHGNDPWIFYMTDKFIAHCLDMAKCTIESLGAYSKSHNLIPSVPTDPTR